MLTHDGVRFRGARDACANSRKDVDSVDPTNAVWHSGNRETGDQIFPSKKMTSGQVEQFTHRYMIYYNLLN